MPNSLLIVDDEHDTVDALKLFLEMKGFTVRAVYSGQEGISAVQQAVPNLVLLDLQMPFMDGWQTLKQMRQVAPDIRVAIVTGSMPDRAIEQLALKEGAVGIVTKPIQIDDLVPKIRAFLQGGKA